MSQDLLREKPEYPSTYVVQDRSNQEELIRLVEQDYTTTKGMGGALPEQSTAPDFQQVLDVGCGTGGWLIETARTYPHISRLIGLDISKSMVDYARAQAETAQVSDRVRFLTGDGLRMVEFTAGSFDLVNHRYGSSFLRKWDWPQLLNEYQRVCRADGVIRITEGTQAEQNSPALTRLFALLYQAFWQAGYTFTPTTDGITSYFPDLMRQHGIEEVQTKTHVLHLHEKPETKQSYINDIRRIFRTTVPFMRKWIKFPDDYDNIYQQMLVEVQQPTFETTNVIITAWGINRAIRH